MKFPQYAVSKWIGHSITVSGKHYANAVPDELFDKAAQNAAQQVPAESRTESRKEKRNPQESQETASCRTGSLEVIGGGGNRTRVP